MWVFKSGRAIRFPETKVRPTGRGAIGVAGIEVDDAYDEVVGMICVNPNNPTRTVMVVSEKGFGKRTAVDEYRITNRGGKGVKTINVTEKTGKLIGIMDVAPKEDMMISCKSGVTIRMNVSQISEQGRATQGVKLIRIDEGDEIAAITKIDEQDEEVIATSEEVISASIDQTETTNSAEISSEGENPVQP